MPLNDDNLEMLLDVLQSFMDDYGLTDPEPEVTYMDNRAFVTIHLDELGPTAEDVDLLELETRIGQLSVLADVDVDVELIDARTMKASSLLLEEDDEDDELYEGFRTFSVNEPEDMITQEEPEDQDVEAVVKSFIEEEAVKNVVVHDDYEPTEDDIQDLYDRFDDASRFSEVEDMGDWD